jgi:hypothetical protein
MRSPSPSTRPDHPDADALTHALAHPTVEQWTGITVRHDEPAEHLDRWLATTDAVTNPASGICFGRLRVTRATRDAGIADPALRWAGASLYTGGSLAYPTARTSGGGAVQPPLRVVSSRPLSATGTDERPGGPCLAEGPRGHGYGSCSAANRSNPARHISNSPATTSSMILSISTYGG